MVPVIISKDYLALYNFGFAGSAGLPQMSEGVMGASVASQPHIFRRHKKHRDAREGCRVFQSA